MFRRAIRSGAILAASLLFAGTAAASEGFGLPEKPGVPGAPAMPRTPDLIDITPEQFAEAVGGWILAPAEPDGEGAELFGAESDLPANELPGDADDATPGRIQFAASHMLAQVPDEIEPYFDLYLYVSKARQGAYGQRMYVYRRDPVAGLRRVAQWLVSTGRERSEVTPTGKKTFTTTPIGLYKLDPDRFFPLWRSRTWGGSRMPWAMFYDAQIRGRMTGLAIHGTGGPKYDRKLGSAASGGCIRLLPAHAKLLYELIQAEMGGVVPVFAINSGTTSREGELERDHTGAPLTTYGYRVLLVVDGFDGVPPDELEDAPVAMRGSQPG